MDCRWSGICVRAGSPRLKGKNPAPGRTFTCFRVRVVLQCSLYRAHPTRGPISPGLKRTQYDPWTWEVDQDSMERTDIQIWYKSLWRERHGTKNLESQVRFCGPG